MQVNANGISVPHKIETYGHHVIQKDGRRALDGRASIIEAPINSQVKRIPVIVHRRVAESAEKFNEVIFFGNALLMRSGIEIIVYELFE